MNAYAPTPVLLPERQIRCVRGHRHRTYAAVVRCRLGRYERVIGEGGYAVVEGHVVPGRYGRRWWGATDLFIHLFQTRVEAENFLTDLPVAPCSGTCLHHYLTVVQPTVKREGTAL